MLQLLDQLKPGGRMIIPVGPEGGSQSLERIDKSESGAIQRSTLMGVIYVPLTSKERQFPSKLTSAIHSSGLQCVWC